MSVTVTRPAPDRASDPADSADRALDLAHRASDRAARARAVLRLAEERTGTGRWVRPARGATDAGPWSGAGLQHPLLGGVPAAPDQAVPDGAAPHEAAPDVAAPDGAASDGVVREAARGEQAAPVPELPGPVPVPHQDLREPEAVARLVPVRRDLAPLLPSGALDRGSTVVVGGSTSLVLALLAEASRSGGWVALVGFPEAGVLAAHQTGLELDRVALVPAPGPDGATVVAALLDGVDVVVVGPRTALGDADRRRLSARARERSAVLMSTTPWPGANVVLTAEESRWEGIGLGHGRLRTRRLTVRRTGRGAAGVGRRGQVVLPAPSTPWDDRAATDLSVVDQDAAVLPAAAWRAG